MQHVTTNPMRGAFLREVTRLIATSGFSVEAVAQMSELPVAALTGAHGGVIRVPVNKVRRIAEITGAEPGELARIWCTEHAPWVLDLFDDLHRPAGHEHDTGARA